MAPPWDGCSLNDWFLRWLLLGMTALCLWVWQQNSLGRNRMSEHFFGYCLVSPALRPSFSDPWRLSPALSSTPTHDYFFWMLSIQFFNLHTHVTYRMPCRAGDHPHSCLRERGISLGVVIILGICLSSHTYLNCTEFTIILDSYLYMSILQKFYLWWKEQQSN